MDQADIKYVLELLQSATDTHNWDEVEDAKETLREFLDDDNIPGDD